VFGPCCGQRSLIEFDTRATTCLPLSDCEPFGPSILSLIDHRIINRVAIRRVVNDAFTATGLVGTAGVADRCLR